MSAPGARRSSGRIVRIANGGVGAGSSEKPAQPRPPATIVTKVDAAHLDRTVQSSISHNLKSQLTGSVLSGAMTKAVKQGDLGSAISSATKTALKAPGEKFRNEVLRSASEAATAGVAKAVGLSMRQLDKVCVMRRMCLRYFHLIWFLSVYWRCPSVAYEDTS